MSTLTPEPTGESVAPGPAGDGAPTRDHDDPPASRRTGAGVVALVGAVALLGLLLRVWPRGAMWLDEAQSVGFARQDLTEIPAALAQDGAPPLYYVVLHGWIGLVGDGDARLRWLSLVGSLVTAVAVISLASRLAGRRAAWIAGVLVAASPFAIRYASEARMYSLVTAEVALGGLALERLLRRPTVGRAVPVAALAAALLWTHYWSLHLLTATVLVLAGHALVERGRGARRDPGRSPALTAVVAIAAGALLWLPWLPTFLQQADHTATPWATGARIVNPFDAATRGAPSGGGPAPPLLASMIAVAVAVGVITSVRARHGTARRRPLVAAEVLGVTTVLATIGTIVSGSASSPRYTSVMWPLVVVTAAAGLSRMPPLPRRSLVAAIVVLGTILAVHEIRTPRTTAPVVSAALLERATDGDAVVVCPDQLGPALVRLLERRGPTLRVVVHPAPASEVGPERVDWTDYTERHAAAASTAAARRAAATFDALAGDRPLHVVWSGTYPPTERACTALVDALARSRRPELVLPDDTSLADHGALWTFHLRSDPGAP